MRRRRLTSGASVVAQAKVRASAAPEKVAPILLKTRKPEGDRKVSLLHSRIDETPDPETGAPRLIVVIPGQEVPELYEFTRLLVQPTLARLLAEGFRLWASTVKERSRYNTFGNLNRRFASFLETLEKQISPLELDEGFWASFIAWLNGYRQHNGKPWAPRTRWLVLNSVKICIEALLDHPEHGVAATILLDKSGFPNNPWPGWKTKTVPTAVLTPKERQALILASLSEIADIRIRLNDREASMVTGVFLLNEAQTKGHAPPYREQIEVCAARIAESFPNHLASISDLFSLDPSLGWAVQWKHRMLPVRKLLYTTFRDLIPFVILLGVKTAFNPNTILSLTWSQIRISADGKTVTIFGVKNRAADTQVSIVSDRANDGLEIPAEPGEPFGLTEVLELLRQLTWRTRTILKNPNHSDRLFVGVPIQSGTDAKAFDHKNGPSCDGAWKLPLRHFIEEHGLAPFTLAMLRPTEGELVWRRTGDLLAVRDRLGHKSIITTRIHYTSDGMRQESQERVAETQAYYHRWAQTHGRVDPRHLPERYRSAATPGFGCLDPFDSPRPGQRKGKLCTAYGECSDCPLGQAWPHDVQAAAYYLALPKAIYDAQLGRIPPKQWVQKWPSILNAQNRIIDQIPSEVRSKASRIHLKLKPVG